MAEKMNAEQLVRAVSDSVNCCNVNPQEVKKAFQNEHRFLQQEMFRCFVLPILEEMSDAFGKGNFDERNRAACYMAYEMLKKEGE